MCIEGSACAKTASCPCSNLEAERKKKLQRCTGWMHITGNAACVGNIYFWYQANEVDLFLE